MHTVTGGLLTVNEHAVGLLLLLRLLLLLLLLLACYVFPLLLATWYLLYHCWFSLGYLVYIKLLLGI